MKKPETKLKELVQKKLTKLKRPLWIEKIQQATIRGTPDILGCSPCDICGRALMFALELKDGDNGVLHPLQDLKLRQIRNAGGCGLVVRRTADLIVLEEYLTRLPPVLDDESLDRLTKYLVEQIARKKERV
jgi:hypothetical protein